MKVLVTGANGQLGRAVVSALSRRGHSVRAMVRPSTAIASLGWDALGIEVYRADLRSKPDLSEAFEGIDVVVHLAAAVSGGEDLQFASTVVSTERLLQAMSKSRTTAMVLASSLSVYDWSAINDELTEACPIESDVYKRDGYAISKIWQEKIVRRAAASHDWRLAVLRPGFIWSLDNLPLAAIGPSIGRFHFVIGPSSQPLMTHVLNCAEAFAIAAERIDSVAGHTVNVIDGHPISSWRLAGLSIRQSSLSGRRVPMPYAVGRALTRVIGLMSSKLFNGRGKLPNIARTIAYEARFKPLRHNREKFMQLLGDDLPMDWDACQKLFTSAARLDPSHPQSTPQGAREVS